LSDGEFGKTWLERTADEELGGRWESRTIPGPHWLEFLGGAEIRMRVAVPFLLQGALLVAVGCSRGAGSPGANPPAQARQLSFNPKLTLKWPGVPTEDSQIMPIETGDVKHYSALFADKQPTGIIIYGAHVMEYPAKTLEVTSPKELLMAYVFAFQKDETSRKEIEHGHDKYAGLEISRHRGDRFDRLLVVMAWPRLYSVEVSSKREELLGSPEVEAFFNSLAIEE
jgi:hypothetical protein